MNYLPFIAFKHMKGRLIFNSAAVAIGKYSLYNIKKDSLDTDKRSKNDEFTIKHTH